MRKQDIFYLTALGPFVGWSLIPAWPSAPHWFAMHFKHALSAFAGGGTAVPTGFSLYDFAQPCFVFITGVAAAFAIPKLVGTSAYFNVYVSFVQSVLLVLAVAYWYRFKKARA